MERLRVPAAGLARRGWVRVVLVALGVGATALVARGALAAQEMEGRGAVDLVGTVTDAGGRPLVGAFVSVEGSDWGSLTGETGRFVIPDLPSGVVTLTAQLIGYETLTWTGAVAGGVPVALTLKEQPILLEGLNVVTDRFESRRRGVATSVRWYDYGILATSTQPNALDFLSARAGLARVPCRGAWSNECLIVRGRMTEPVVWVDEAPVIGGLDYLRVVPPHELYMVEVYASGRHIRAYTQRFMERAAKNRIQPMALLF